MTMEFSAEAIRTRTKKALTLSHHEALADLAACIDDLASEIEGLKHPPFDGLDINIQSHTARVPTEPERVVPAR